MLKIAAIAALLLAWLSGSPVQYPAGILAEQFESSGAAELEQALPEETAGLLERLGIELSADSVGSVDPDEAFEAVAGLAAGQADLPLGACIASVGIAVLCALGRPCTEGSNLARGYETMSAAATVLTVCVPAAGFIDSAARAIASMCGFSSVLVPVLAGLAYIGGHAASAAAYSGFTLAVIEGITLTSGSVLVPFLRILLGICAAGSLCGTFDFGRLTAAMEKSAKWLLGILGVLLSGTMGMSAVAASAADTAAARGTRFVISGAVPVVGGAISDAIGTIANCVGIVRSSAGSFGIIAGLFILLPTVILALLWMAGLNFASWAVQALGAERPAAVMRSLGSVVSLTLGLMVFTAVVLTCSAALIINLRSA